MAEKNVIRQVEVQASGPSRRARTPAAPSQLCSYKLYQTGRLSVSPVVPGELDIRIECPLILLADPWVNDRALGGPGTSGATKQAYKRSWFIL